VLPPDPRPQPDQTLQQVELRGRLFHAIDSLSPPERAIWIATEIDGRAFNELAEEWDAHPDQGQPMPYLKRKRPHAEAAAQAKPPALPWVRPDGRPRSTSIDHQGTDRCQ